MEFVFENDNNSHSEDGFDFSVPTKSDIFDPGTIPDTPQITKPSKTKRASTRRKVVTQVDDIEFNEPPKRAKRKRATGPKVNYVKSTSKKKKSLRKIQWTWSKAGWIFAGLLVFRLILMEGGVVDYYSMENTLQNKEHSLELLRKENASIIQEVHKIKTSTAYQKKLAREHLGVIAKDEYLILFAQDHSGNGRR